MVRWTFFSLVFFSLVMRDQARAQSFWESTNGPPGGTVFSLAFNSTGALLAGTGGTGVFVQPPGGTTWIAANTGLGNLEIYSLLGLSNGVVVVGTGQGVSRSTDGGQTWSSSSLDFGVNASLTSRSDLDLFVGTLGGNAGILRSIDGGATWTQPALFGYSVSALVFSPSSNSLFAGSPANGIFRSTDAGLSWVQVNNGLSDSLVLSLALSSSGNLFAGTRSAVFRSTNNGVNWTSVSAGLSTAPKQALAVNAAGHIFVGSADQGVFRSINNGANWNPVNTGLTNLDVRSLILDPGGVIHAGTGNGTVFRSKGSTVPPGVPILVFPADSALNQPVNIQLRWNASAQAVDYRLQVSTDPQFTTTIVDDTALTVTARTVGPLANGTTYYWRVSAKNLGGSSAYSTRRFTTVSTGPTIPAAPTLVSPPDDATDLPTFVTLLWNSSPGATSYHLQLSTDSTFTITAIDDSTLVDTSLQFTDLFEATTYYWHVSAKNSAGTSVYSARWRFTTAGVPFIQVNPLLLNFGDISSGSTASDTATILSVGTGPLVVDSVRIVGVDASEFTVFGSQGPFAPIDPSGSIRVIVQFIPTTSGPKAASLVIHSNTNPGYDTVALVGRSGNPVLRVTVNGLPITNGTVGIGVRIPVGIAVVSESLYVRNAGQTAYQAFELIGITIDSFFVSIPSNYLNIRGVEYYVVIKDVQGFPFTFPELNPAANPAILRVGVVNAQSSFSLSAQQYKMVSVPLELQRTGTFELLTDDFGPYQRNIWRLFHWESGAYVEHPQISATTVPGNAAWIITHAGGVFDTDSGRSVLSSSPYVITLPPNDWAQVANPFAFPVDWQAITKSGSVKGPYYFDGASYLLDTTTALVPWEGYFVFNDEVFPVTLTVPVLEASPAPPSQHHTNTPGEYAVRFSVQGQGTDASRSETYVGLRMGATEQYDGFDYPAPPPSPHGTTRLATIDNGREYMMNFKPPSEQGASWELKIISNEHVGHVNVGVGIIGELPLDHHVFVYDTQDGRVVACDGGSFVVEGPVNSRIMNVIVGTIEYAKSVLGDIPLQPIEFDLQQNYPNPFNPQTTIQYQVAKRSHVLMEIFNMLGQRVRLLVNEEQPTGFHSVVWDGRNDGGVPAGSGIYFYRMAAGEFVESHKLILVR